MHIHHRCNLKCRYCVHYCDYGYGGEVPFEEGGQWLRAWAERLHPKAFHLLGGEPLLSRDAEKYILLVAELFPDAERSLTTNGVLLTERPQILDLLLETGAMLTISLHAGLNDQQAARLNQGLRLALQYREKGLKLEVFDTTRGWSKLYLGEGNAIRPFAGGDPDKCFRNCIVGLSRIIHNGRLYKCPSLAFLPFIADRLETKDLWEPYLHYRPLETTDSDEAFEAFLRGESSCCDMCPEGKKRCDAGALHRDVLSGLCPVYIYA